MDTLVAAHVDAIDRETRERQRGALDRVRRAEIREDRAVVIDVGVYVEEAHAAGFDGIAEGADQVAITSLADVGNRL
jgi:hypothetical protein